MNEKSFLAKEVCTIVDVKCPENASLRDIHFMTVLDRYALFPLFTLGGVSILFAAAHFLDTTVCISLLPGSSTVLVFLFGTWIPVFLWISDDDIIVPPAAGIASVV